MSVRLLSTPEELGLAYPVMRELRPHLDESQFVSRVQAQMQQGYQLAALSDGDIVALAGYRYLQNLAWGRFLYVDDLVTKTSSRSAGYGKLLLDWLQKQAQNSGCDEIHLDSGVQRKDAHRFYLREAMTLSSYHFQSKV